MFKHLLWPFLASFLFLCGSTLADHIPSTYEFEPVIPFRIHNATDKPVTFTLIPGECYEGWAPDSLVYGPVPANSMWPPSDQQGISLFRDQIGDCEGVEAYFKITTDVSTGDYPFAFSNDGYLVSQKEYQHQLDADAGSDLEARAIPDHLGVTGSSFHEYTWTFSEDVTSPRHALPDTRLQHPRNYIAFDSGVWGSVGSDALKVDTLVFERNGFIGTYYLKCFGYDTFHSQHVKRLPNKNGRAYFMVAQSKGHNGQIFLVETYDGVLDPATDLVQSQNDGTPVGRIIWEDFYTGTFNGLLNPVGNWNHPAKMAVMGGVLVVVAQNWSENKGLDGCTKSTTNPYQRGTSEDKLLFYDIRDPAKPRYWGQMSATELGIYDANLSNGADGDTTTARQIDSLHLTRDPESSKYFLTAGGTGGFVTFEADQVSPDIDDWTSVDYPPPTPDGFYTQQHGDDFTSYQLAPRRYLQDPPLEPLPGIARNMQFAIGDIYVQYIDALGNGDSVYITEAIELGVADTCKLEALDNTYCALSPTRDGFIFTPVPSVEGDGFIHTGDLPGEDVDWDADSFYVTRKGEPIVYSAMSKAGGDGEHIDPYILQVHDTRNAVAGTHAVLTTVGDSNASLRDAMGYGALVKFDPAESASQFNTAGEPFAVHPYHLTLDASDMPGGVLLRGDGVQPVITIAPGNSLNMKNIQTADDPLADLLNTLPPALPWATSSFPAGWFATGETSYTGAAQSGDIGDGGQSVIQTAVTGPGTLSFEWSVRSEAGGNFLRFYLDYDEVPGVAGISGVDGGWQSKTLNVPSGIHQLKWVFSKDLPASDVKNNGFLRNVNFLPEPPIVEIPDNLQLTATQGVGYIESAATGRGYMVPTNVAATGFTASGLPSGMWINSDTGEISGAPAVYSSTPYTVTVYASNVGGTSTGVTLKILVEPSPVTIEEAIDYINSPIPIHIFGEGFYGQTQPSEAHDGIDSAKSIPRAYSKNSSTMFIKLWGPGHFGFWWKQNVGSGCLANLTAQGTNLEPGSFGVNVNNSGSGWEYKTQELPEDLVFIGIASICNTYGDTSGALLVDEVSFTPTLANALDTPPIGWNSSDWFGWTGRGYLLTGIDTQYNVPYQRDSAQSGPIGDNQSAILETAVSVPGPEPARLEFESRVSSQYGDYLSFHVDDVLQIGSATRRSGNEIYYHTVQVDLQPGPQPRRLKWEYKKNASGASGADAAWVDRVTLTPAHPLTSQTTVLANVGTAISHQVSAANQANTFVFDGLPPGLKALPDGSISGTPALRGTFPVTVKSFYRDVGGFTSSWGETQTTLTFIIDDSSIDTGSALDAPGFTWGSSDQTTAWFGEVTTVNDGSESDAARSSGGVQDSDLVTTMQGPGVLDFWWKVSSEAGGGYLSFSVDGIPQQGHATSSWLQRSVALTENRPYTLRWTHHKGSSADSGDAIGWLDEVSFTSSLVTNDQDSGAGSLRQVLTDLPAGATVLFHDDLSGGEILLGGTELALTQDVVIDASSLANGLTVNANSASRAFSIAGGADVTLRGLSISNGQAANNGGGIHNTGSTLTLENSTLADNHARYYGGALFNFDGATSTILNSTLRDNSCTERSGGAIYNGNDATSRVIVLNSTISGNIAGASGGGAHNYLGELTLIHSTITNNSAGAGSGQGLGQGGGILTIENSIIAGNPANNPAEPDIWSQSWYTINVSGKNLIGTNQTVEDKFPSIDPLIGTMDNPLFARLGPLEDNRGPTFTHAPLFDSPAIDAGLLSSGVYTDQRGQARTRQGAGPDIGAVELKDSDGDGVVDAIEINNGTNPALADSDGDGLLDGGSGALGIEDYPIGLDLDGDNLVDGEAAFGTNPNKSDTDGDGTDDHVELLDHYGSDPLDPSNYRGDGNANETGIVDAGDVVICTRVAIGLESQTPQYEFHCDAAPEVDGAPQPDGNIGAGDVLKVQQKVLGNPSP